MNKLLKLLNKKKKFIKILVKKILIVLAMINNKFKKFLKF